MSFKVSKLSTKIYRKFKNFNFTTGEEERLYILIHKLDSLLFFQPYLKFLYTQIMFSLFATFMANMLEFLILRWSKASLISIPSFCLPDFQCIKERCSLHLMLFLGVRCILLDLSGTDPFLFCIWFVVIARRNLYGILGELLFYIPMPVIYFLEAKLHLKNQKLHSFFAK